MELIRNLIDRQKSGEIVGITSICSAHPLVIEASFAHALRADAALVLSHSPPQVRRDIYRIDAEPGRVKRSAAHAAGTVGYELMCAVAPRVAMAVDVA